MLSILTLLSSTDYKLVTNKTVDLKSSELCLDLNVDCFAESECRKIPKTTVLFAILKEDIVLVW